MTAHKKAQAERRLDDAEVQVKRLTFVIQQYHEELAKLVAARKLQQARITRARAAIAKAERDAA